MKPKLYEITEKESKGRSITTIPASIEDFREERLPLKKSKKIEKPKVKIAEEIFRNNPEYTPLDMCFIASKHAIQSALAMKN
ncbi:hypothetical protein NLB96_00280 [Candidatus Aminicenantes bacterium AC-335-K20]|jgi:hypothetical protein|nr:hypothetical protein [SCandidatus Aminicenantes bacterium Aminicenantia_JdfR_composite]MCP2619198.1 hypothetical protein [Candidatus Aminicenantes bacterium AC-335-K20]